MHDVNILDHLIPEPGAFYIMDRGYVDFERLARLDGAGSFFVTRAKSNMRARRRYSHPVDRTTGLICDQTVVLTGFYARQDFARPLRRIKLNTPETGKSLVFLTNNFALPALTIARLYKHRWQVELFFKWIKQHLRIKAFFGTSENAVKAQIWSAVCVYVLAAIVKKRLAIKASLYEMLQILSLTLFEKSRLLQLFTDAPLQISPSGAPNQLNLID
jgi:IS4 transposase